MTRRTLPTTGPAVRAPGTESRRRTHDSGDWTASPDEPHALPIRVERWWRGEKFSSMCLARARILLPLGRAPDMGICRESIAVVARRHEALHSRLAVVNDRGIMDLDSGETAGLDVVELPRADIQDHIRRPSALSEFFAMPFNLFEEAGFRCRAFRDEDENVTLGNIDASIFPATPGRRKLLRREIQDCYAAIAGGTASDWCNHNRRRNIPNMRCPKGAGLVPGSAGATGLLKAPAPGKRASHQAAFRPARAMPASAEGRAPLFPFPRTCWRSWRCCPAARAIFFAHDFAGGLSIVAGAMVRSNTGGDRGDVGKTGCSRGSAIRFGHLDGGNSDMQRARGKPCLSATFCPFWPRTFTVSAMARWWTWRSNSTRDRYVCAARAFLPGHGSISYPIRREFAPGGWRARGGARLEFSGTVRLPGHLQKDASYRDLHFLLMQYPDGLVGRIIHSLDFSSEKIEGFIAMFARIFGQNRR